jgi:hypothetical protein
MRRKIKKATRRQQLLHGCHKQRRRPAALVDKIYRLMPVLEVGSAWKAAWPLQRGPSKEKDIRRMGWLRP